MKFDRIYVSEDKNAYFDTYLIENSKELHDGLRRPAVVVCPGGGYKNLSDREAEPIALQFASMGYHAFVLRYSVDEKAVMPRPIHEIARTMAYIKDHSVEWNLDSDHVYVAGFSAGGHLAASLGVFWNHSEMLPEYEGDRERIRPAGLILGYPVIDLKSTSTRLYIGTEGYPEYKDIAFDMMHPALSYEDVYVREDNRTLINFEVAMNAYMFGGLADDKQIWQYSLQNHVSKDTPPAFIWHGGYDGLIFPQNSLKFASALAEAKVPYELHIYGAGDHGLSLANHVTSNNPWEIVPECQGWIDLARVWLENQIAHKY